MRVRVGFGFGLDSIDRRALAVAAVLPVATAATATSTSSRSHLGLHGDDLSTTETSALGIDPLEHGRVLEHIGQDHPTNLAATNEGILERRTSAVARCVRDVGQLTVHVVLGLDQLAAIDVARLELDRHNVLLGFM